MDNDFAAHIEYVKSIQRLTTRDPYYTVIPDDLLPQHIFLHKGSLSIRIVLDSTWKGRENRRLLHMAHVGTDV